MRPHQIHYPLLEKRPFPHSRGSYTDCMPGRGEVLVLPPGEYVARLIYVSAWLSDPDNLRANVWEGRLEAPPVRFTVAAPTSSELAQITASI
jgi:hypothetical protein